MVKGCGKVFLAVMVMGLVLGGMSQAQAQNMIQVKGSDSEVNLVQRLAEVFMKNNPGVNIAVTGGGSGTGLAALINKQTDIANSSRELSAKEEESAKQKGVQPFRVVFATDGISVIVHPENPVQRLTMEQLGKIFKGEITDWKEVRRQRSQDLPLRKTEQFRNLCIFQGVCG
jgi:phosphate transport system substrate-binding protein